MVSSVLIIIGCIVGAMLGLTGAGGGVLAIPLLVVLADLGPSEAISTSLVGVTIISVMGTIRSIIKKELLWKVTLPAAVAAILGAPMGTWAGQYLSEALLGNLFVILSLMIVVLMWRNGCQYENLKTSSKKQSALVQWGGSIGAGLATGILSGLFGVGGGFLLVPALTLLGGQPMRVASVSSLFIISLSAGSAIVSRSFQQIPLPWAQAFTLASAGLLTYYISDRLAKRIRPCRLKEIFAISLAGVLLIMFVQQTFLS
ncbi:MAG: sulfite exporter TauE/SafE family protein [Planctomycetes bacterium]|nr:sulfite exporter TauE/SafE family protein [Planctomycetota bacterium]